MPSLFLSRRKNIFLNETLLERTIMKNLDGATIGVLIGLVTLFIIVMAIGTGRDKKKTRDIQKRFKK